MRYGDSMPVSRFGAMVRAYRREAGLTQRELATKAGLSVAALRDFEQCRRRRPRPSSLSALATALELDPAQAAHLAGAAMPARQNRNGAAVTPARPAETGSVRPAIPGRPGQGLWLAALGPLEVYRDGRPLALGSLARRTALGLLLMSPNVPVRRDVIVDVLWTGKPPPTAVGLVQAYMSRLRKVLQPPDQAVSEDGIIESVRGAYRLNLSGQEVDLLAFRDLAARATAARANGDHGRACELYEQAVSLWRGDPLADVDLLSGHPGVTVLRQQLADVLFRYADVASALGEHRRVLPRLRALTAAEPLNEQAHARLMIALAGSGQQAAAIRMYEDLRRRLDQELGLYPGDGLVQAHLRVLRQDIAASPAARPQSYRPGSATASPVMPRQLPVPPRFSGRGDELRALFSLLEQGQGAADGVVIAAITGMAGIGKTALAVHWAHQVAGRFPDGQLFVDLRGSGPADTLLEPAEAVRYFLTALGVPAARIPADPAGRAGLYRSLLAGRRMLIVLDNAQDAEQVRPLLPGSPHCLVLVTSRNRLTGLAAAEGARLLTLGALTDAESQALLASSLGAGRVMAEPAAVSELPALCARLPLALRGVAARAAARPNVSLTMLAAGMRDGLVGTLDALETGEPATSVRMKFSWSHAKLSPPAARMFGMLGIHPGPDITVAAAASLAGTARNEAYLALAELCDGHMLAEHAPGRYTFHDLLRAYAAEVSHDHDGETGRRAAVHRVLDHYLRTADAASAALYADYTPLSLGRLLPGVQPEDVDDPQRAERWFEDEQHVLLAAVDQAVSDSYAPHAWELPWAVGLFFGGEAYWPRIAAAQETALALAVKLGHLDGQVLAHHHLNLLRLWRAGRDSVSHHLAETAELATNLGFKRLSARADLTPGTAADQSRS
jgi:DNA-binding SARP family transcriptional activator/transcriptional regulator with XRE-family HTH domain